MGQEFCNGCQDCTNFKDFENNFSYFGNQPLKNLKNPIYENGNLDNSIFNIKTEYPSDTSFLSNTNQNTNQQKNENTKDISFNNKQANNENSDNPLININNKQDNENNNNINNIITENNFNGIDYNINNNNIETNNKKESSENNDEYYIFDSNLNKIMDNENNINSLDEEDKKRLEDIIKNNRAKKISELFKQFVEKKSISHQILCTEYSTINDYQNIQNNLRTDLTVNLIPENNYIYISELNLITKKMD